MAQEFFGRGHSASRDGFIGIEADCITRGGDNSAPVLVQDQGGRVAKVDTHLITTAVVLPIASRHVRFNPFRVLRALKAPGINRRCSERHGRRGTSRMVG